MTDEQRLIERYIALNPQRPSLADVRLIEYGVPVWAIVGHWKMVDEDAARVAEDYEVPIEAVQAALAYYRRHKDVIEARIAANAA